ncbi:MAG TPA: hypothetical protein VFG47_06260 [Geminicoccaceae bacterium]|nr:hypothetical protein [Geminicoccaceae bacterium]
MALPTRRGFARALRRGSRRGCSTRPTAAMPTPGSPPAVRRGVRRLYRALDPKELAAGGA